MRRYLLLVLLSGSLLAPAAPAFAQADPGDRLSLEALTAPQPGDGQAHHPRSRAYAGSSSYGHGGYGHGAPLTRRHNNARSYYHQPHYHGSGSGHHARPYHHHYYGHHYYGHARHAHAFQPMLARLA